MSRVTVTKTRTKVTESGPAAQVIVVDTEPAVTQSKDSQPLPGTTTIITVACITAVCVWALVQVFKTLIRGWMKSKKKEEPWWYSGTLRLTAIILGGIAGSALYGSLGGIGSGWPWGTLIGCGAGALSAILVAVIKARLRKAAG